MRLSGKRYTPNLLWASKPWLSQAVLAAIVVAFTIVVVRPFSTAPDLSNPDVAQAWNQSVARLGILPVFPPEEDFHVGDVWAVVADTDETGTPLLGKAMRLAHLDLRSAIKQARGHQPEFPETTAPKPGETLSHQDNREVIASKPDDDRIALTLTAFPGITINHTTRGVGSLGATLFGFGSARDELQMEQIRIPVAETYGAPALSGFLDLDAWCADARTKLYCTDAFVRQLMAFAVSGKVLATRDGQYVARLQLRLVTRVFVTREIEHRKRQSRASGAAVWTAVDRPQPAPASSNAQGKPPNATTQLASAAPDPQSPGAKVSASRDDDMEVSLRQVFQRPVVIGYRAITITLTPAQPSKEVAP
jgi:hypothetical protein